MRARGKVNLYHNEEEKYWLGQCLRGLCILCVVAIHSQTGSAYPRNSFSFHYWVVLRQILNCAVPVFSHSLGITQRESILKKVILSPGGRQKASNVMLCLSLYGL